MKTIKWIIMLGFISGLLILSCNYYVSHEFRRTYQTYNEAIHVQADSALFLKCHMQNGDVGLLQRWSLNEKGDTIYGAGKYYDFNRNLLQEGPMNIAILDVTLFETNDLNTIRNRDRERIAAQAFMLGINVAGGIICLTNPKACFGSCPTFYLDGSGSVHTSDAEGFSSSIAPALAKTDIDALNLTTASRYLELRMKNEALETHVVDQVSLMAVPVEEEQVAFHSSDDQFYTANKTYKPRKALGPEGSCLSLLRASDERERFSRTDSFDLGKKEEIYLEFEAPDQEDSVGIVVQFRQTLVTTFLVYTGLSYMGDEIGDFLYKLETKDRVRDALSGTRKIHGGIEVWYWQESSGKWVWAGEMYETGPIARNTQMVPWQLDHVPGKPLKVKLVMAKGLWRLDRVALAGGLKKAEAISVSPDGLYAMHEQENRPVTPLLDRDEYPLVSLPGDDFKIHFSWPHAAGDQWVVFLRSRGYYLEWMRESWIKEKDPSRLRRMLRGDEQVWRELALEFKAMEASADSVFWNSKYSLTQ